jgi:hypothetical protein
MHDARPSTETDDAFKTNARARVERADVERSDVG